MRDIKLPDDFTRRMQQQLGDEAESFFNALVETAPTSIRLNPFKGIENGEWRMEKESSMENGDSMENGEWRMENEIERTKKFSILNSQFSIHSKVAWCDDGFYLAERPAFIYDPLFHAGLYYVQEASSMFVGTVAESLLRDIENPVVLDAAAAPGGKSTHLLSIMNNRGVLFSNEVIPQRNSILQENIWKWGISNSVITQQQLFEFSRAGEFFDLIVLDAPCSGEGLFRRDPEACNEWSPQSVTGCSLRQRQLIDDLLPCLKTGGYLIYSTCTYATEENDDTIEQAIAKHPLEKVNIEIPDRVFRTKHGFQFYPHRVEGEGFFISVLRKTDSVETIETPTRPFKQKQSLQRINNPNPEFALNKNEFTTYKLGNLTFAVPRQVESLLTELALFNIKSMGTPLTEQTEYRAIPHAALALHAGFNVQQATDVTKVVELDYQNALNYLYGDALANETGIKQGYASAQFKGHNLGWMKAATNRFNNLYPHPWRIRKRRQ